MISHIIEAPLLPDLNDHPSHMFIMKYRIEKLFDLITPHALAAVERKDFRFRIAQFDKMTPLSGIPYLNTAFGCRPSKELRYAFAAENENDDIELFIRSVNFVRVREIVASLGIKRFSHKDPVHILWRYDS